MEQNPKTGQTLKMEQTPKHKDQLSKWRKKWSKLKKNGTTVQILFRSNWC